MSPSPLRLFGSLAAVRLSTRRICTGSARRLLHHQSKNHEDDVRRSGLFSPRRASIVTAVTLSSALVGGMLYFKQLAEEPPTEVQWLTAKHAATLEEVIAEEGDAAKEAVLKPMFEEWMVKYGRRYESEEEKTMRYREFKRHVKNIEKANALGSGKPCFKLNSCSDSTKAESRNRCGCLEPLPMELMFMLCCHAMYRRVVKWWNQRRGNQGDVE